MSEPYQPHHNPLGYWVARGPSGDHGCYTQSEAMRTCKDFNAAYAAGLAARDPQAEGEGRVSVGDVEAILREEMREQLSLSKYESMSGSIACEAVAQVCEELIAKVRKLNPPTTEGQGERTANPTKEDQ